MKINGIFGVSEVTYDFILSIYLGNALQASKTETCKDNNLTSSLKFYFTVSNDDIKDLSGELKETKGADMHVIVKSVRLDRHEIAKHKARVNIN